MYTGKQVKPAPVVTLNGKKLVKGTDYAVSYKNNTAAGTATVTIAGKGIYTGTKTATFRIKKAANPITVKAKSPAVQASKVRQGDQAIIAKDAYTVSKAKGKVAYEKVSGNKMITVSSAGKITVKKGLKKNAYAVKVKVSAKGNANYKAGSQTVSVKVSVK